MEIVTSTQTGPDLLKSGPCSEKNVGAPTCARRNFCRRADQGIWGTEFPQRCPGAEPWWVSGGEAPEADGILLKMTYTDIAFLVWGPHFCGGPCSAEHAEHA